MTEKAKGNKNIAPPSKEYLKDEKDKSKEKLFSKYGILGGLMLFILLLIIF